MPQPESGYKSVSVLHDTAKKIKACGLILEQLGDVPRGYDYWVVGQAVNAYLRKLKSKRRRSEKQGQ